MAQKIKNIWFDVSDYKKLKDRYVTAQCMALFRPKFLETFPNYKLLKTRFEKSQSIVVGHILTSNRDVYLEQLDNFLFNQSDDGSQLIHQLELLLREHERQAENFGAQIQSKILAQYDSASFYELINTIIDLADKKVDPLIRRKTIETLYNSYNQKFLG